jgi:hypothetical protein
MGFWIFANVNTTLTVYGEIPTDTQIILRAGWNLVGYPTLNTTTTLTNALFGTGYLSVEGEYFASPYLMWLNDSYIMQPGEGYWVYVPADAMWNVTNYYSLPIHDETNTGSGHPTFRGAGDSSVPEGLSSNYPSQNQDISAESLNAHIAPDCSGASSGTLPMFIMAMLLAFACLTARKRREY